MQCLGVYTDQQQGHGLREDGRMRGGKPDITRGRTGVRCLWRVLSPGSIGTAQHQKEIDRVLFKNRDSWHSMKRPQHRSGEVRASASEVSAMQERRISGVVQYSDKYKVSPLKS